MSKCLLEMPLTCSRKLKTEGLKRVFLTAYDHYAIEALNNHASYLLKPISIDELIKAVDHVTQIKEKENDLQNKILSQKSGAVSGKITIPQLDGFEVLDVNDILFCKADDNYTEIHLANSKNW